MQTLEPPTDSPRFGSSSPPLNISIDKVRSEMAKVAKQPGTPIPVANAIYAAIWFLNVAAFRAQEEETIAAGKFDTARDEHRFMLTNIIADGERVLLGIIQNGLAVHPNRITADDVRATLESLHSAFYCEYGPKNSAQTTRLIEGLFDVATA